MKTNKIILPLVALATVALSSCKDDMDFHEYAVYDKEYIELNFGNIGGFMTDLYNGVEYDFGNYSGGAMRGAATDECVFSQSGNGIEDFFNGAWSAANPKSSEWTGMYQNIAVANHFLEEFQGLTFPELDLNTDYGQQMHRYQNYQYEARFLRAYYYFALVRQYGGVPLISETLPASEQSMLSRNSSDEIFKFIFDECNDIKDKIIVNYSQLGEYGLGTPETGRADQLAVLALRARAALYWASPLFNPSNDASRWQTAASYIKECLDTAAAQGKTMVKDYAQLWGDNVHTIALSEILYARRYYGSGGNGVDHLVEGYNWPIGAEGKTTGSNCPTQNLVEAYDLKDGSRADWSDPNKAAEIWANLDPRFKATVAVNGEQWPTYSGATPLETYVGGKDGEPIVNATTTSYYLKKLCVGAIDLGASSTFQNAHHSYIIFRLGELYLDYAEALYKLTGSADQAPAGHNMTARQAASMTRTRVSMPELAGNGQTFWENLQRERFVELAFEGHRFWDLRRWKEADKYLTSVVGLQINKAADGTLSYRREVSSRTWNDKMYLYPIPQTEIAKNPNLEQNPGW